MSPMVSEKIEIAGAMPVARDGPSCQWLLDALPMAVYTCDAEGRVALYNPAAVALWGRQPDIGKDRWSGAWKMYRPDGSLLAPDLYPMALAMRQRQTSAGVEIVIERPDHVKLHVMSHPQPLFDSAGVMVGAVNMLVDITDRKRAERLLSESEQAWRLMFDSSPVAQMLQVPFSTITHVNDRLVKMSGYDRAELVGRTVEQLGLRVDDELSQRFIAELKAHGKVHGLELHVQRKDGAKLLVLVSSTSVALNGITYRLHSFFDITGQRQAEQAARLSQQAMASISQGLLISGPDRLTLSVNQAFVDMTGYTQDEMLGRSCAMLQGPQTSPETVAQLRSALDAAQSFNCELLNYRKDGTRFWNELSINPVFGSNGQLTHFVGVLRDVTRRNENLTQLKLAAQVFAQGQEGIMVADAQRNLVMVNQAFTAISGYTEAEVLGRKPRLFASGRQDDDQYDAIWEAVEARGVWQGEAWGRRKDGTEYPEWLTVSAVHDQHGAVCNYIGTFSDISEQKAAHERINWLSHFDVLTGLPNRTLLADRCTHAISTAQRDGKPVAMMVLGIDRFKLVNETLGHAVGDQVLKQFAKRVTGALRDQDTVARVGGDEFVLVLPGDSPDGAARLATRLLHIVAQPYQVNHTELSVTASLGIAIYPSDGLDFDALFKSAEVAMHQAKELGRGTHRFFSAAMFESTMAQAALVAALRTAVAQDQLQLRYQPFVDMQTGEMGGMEALLRWNHPDLGAVPPAQFIPAAEQSGLIMEIGAWVLRQACHDMRDWIGRGVKTPPVSVNISPAQFRDAALLQQIESTLREFEIEPGMLCVEVTEGALMEDVKRSETVLRSLKDLGVKLSLDDFGTGYSSLSYLKLFPFDKVKIDQSFVRGLSNNAQDAVIAKVVISMAHGLGLRVIAEGVETEAQCEFMRGNACDEIQGYFFSRPVPKEQLEALLIADRRLPAHLMRVQTKARTLLLVDDEPNVLAALKRLLRRDAYQILTASNGPQGLELLANNPVDIIVSDQRMPGMTGVEFLRQAKALYPDTIRIVLSGYTELQSVTDAINEGAIYRFLTKPWDDSQLRSFIEEAFQHKELADENRQLNLKIRTANQELATSNRQLHEMLGNKQREIARGEISLHVVREALQRIPMPVIALDDDGLIAFVNTHAQDLFALAPDLLGRGIAAALPKLDALLAATPEGEYGLTDVGDQAYRVQWHRMGEHSTSSGRIVTLSRDTVGAQP